jgi:Cytochrome c554 and c-prime
MHAILHGGLIPLALATSLLGLSVARAQSPATIADQFSTAERVKQKGWWPTKGDAPSGEYVGPAACTRCHSDVSASQKNTRMAQTSSPAADSELLRSHDNAAFAQGPFNYQISSGTQGEVYKIADSKATVSEWLSWAFGSGNNGQSYLFEHDGSWYEARMSFFRSSGTFGLTPNHPAAPAESIDKAIGRKFAASEAPKCFGCHTTASATSETFAPAKSIPGVTCEVCHGPGATHVAMEKNGAREEGAGMVLNPRKLSPADSVDFCGACHRTWWDVNLEGLSGIGTLRFPAYRLEKSRCWGKGDARVTCVACHDPHQLLVKDSASYDTRCLSCHVTSGAKPTADHPGAACTVATKDCASCHMPQYEVPDMHTKFTDHMIRVVRKDSPFPD